MTSNMKRIGEAAGVNDRRFHADCVRNVADLIDTGDVNAFGIVTVDSEGRVRVVHNRCPGASDFEIVQLAAGTAILHQRATDEATRTMEDA